MAGQRITQAEHVQYDPETDIRQPLSVVEDPDELDELNRSLHYGDATLESGLVGWGSMTHTLYLAGAVYHVAVSD